MYQSPIQSLQNKNLQTHGGRDAPDHRDHGLLNCQSISKAKEGKKWVLTEPITGESWKARILLSLYDVSCIPCWCKSSVPRGDPQIQPSIDCAERRASTLERPFCQESNPWNVDGPLLFLALLAVHDPGWCKSWNQPCSIVRARLVRGKDGQHVAFPKEEQVQLGSF